MDVRMAAALAGAVRNVSAFCAEQQISRQTFYKWRRRFAAEGVAGLTERSRRPASSPGAIPMWVQEEILRLRKQLQEDGADHGPDSIRWQLLTVHDPAVVPSRATIWRILARHGLIVAEPAKRPKSSLRRFVHARPNECWQSDWTGWTLADGTPVAIAGTLDDHSRYLAALRVGLGEADAQLVWSTMTAAIAECGVPAMSLTDNGLVYSGYRRGKTVAFETNLRALGVRPICSSPYHPQTCGKIERLWQTLKRWLHARDPATSLDELAALTETFRHYYNTERPHRALHPPQTPAQAFAATVKARPAPFPLPTPVTVTTTTITEHGVTAAHGYLVAVGRRWAGHHATVITDGTHISIFSGTRLIRELNADPTRKYQPATTARYDLRGHREPRPMTP
ncbi:integrase core domain-containing protein [Jiangella muralis]|uniref:integrase core domain-containing protein n=1 Tax=Jiangella muralis TaxID=702383 RepID=UPI001969E6E4|nr:integrase core domain-containing protein [Jiangella muralis]